MDTIPDQHRTSWADATRPIRDPADYDAAIAAFGRTYRTHADPLAIVDLYQAVLEYRGDHPEAKSGRVSTALDVPRSTIRRWVDEGAIPYVVQGIQTVEDRGWLPIAPDSGDMEVFARLVAWVFASGSIHGERFAPQFVVDDDASEGDLTRLLGFLGCVTVEPDVPGTGLKGTVLGASPDGSILGRVLAVLGAPVGNEKQGRGLELPPWLSTATPAVRFAFAQTYVRLRDKRQAASHGELAEARTERFRESLIAFLRDVTGERVTISSATEIYVSTAAMRELGLAEPEST